MRKKIERSETCLEKLELKPNYSILGGLYGIDRRTTNKRYNEVENKKKKKLDKHKLNIPVTNMNAVYKYIQMNIDEDIENYSNSRKYVLKISF